MFYIDTRHPRDKELLEEQQLPLARFDKIVATVKRANNSYFELSQGHTHFFKMLATSDMLIQTYSEYNSMSQQEKQEWAKIKDVRIGDRGYVNRLLIAEMQQELPHIYTSLVDPHIASQASGKPIECLELSDEIDALMLGSSIPAYFRYLEKLTIYKKGVFSQIRRGYISFLQVKVLHLASNFLKTFEQDFSILEKALLNEQALPQWAGMTEQISNMCDRADPNHHDTLSLHGTNCLRSIYISIFNIAMGLLRADKPVPVEIRRFLPVIPDKISFTKESLEEAGAWERYQDHHFLFLNLPGSARENLRKCLSELSPTQRVMWMGCLGKGEIRALVFPMISQGNHLKNLAEICHNASGTDADETPFMVRVWDVLLEIYVAHLKENSSTPDSIHHFFKKIPETLSRPPMAAQEAVDLSVLQNLSFLLVDDSKKIRQMTTKVLKDAGVNRILEAENGLEAWELLQGNPVDVVLCDWIMPELTGIELVKRVMQVERLACNLTFLMLTTVDDKASIVEALSVGVRGYLIKPFSRKQLLDKVFFATRWLQKEQQMYTPVENGIRDVPESLNSNPLT